MKDGSGRLVNRNNYVNMTSNTTLKVRLSMLSFLEFAIWGSYLVSMGMFLAAVGLGDKVYLFYMVQGLVSLVMPALIGIVADRWIPAQKTLSLCHFISGLLMCAVGVYAWSSLPPNWTSLTPDQLAGTVGFGTIFTLYTISVAFYMPTIGLCNSVAFNALEKAGLDTVKDFPPIRVFGTVGFIVAELLINFIHVGGVSIQGSFTQFLTSALFSLVMAFYSLTMPVCPVNKGKGGTLSEALGLNAFKLFRQKKMAIFFIFSMLLGVSLQITNGYGTMYIEQFKNITEYAQGFLNGWFASNPTFLISISQCSEAICILAIPFCLKRFGIKGVMMMAMFAWVLRFGLLGIGDTNMPGIFCLVLSCIVYGVAFDFFNVSGGIYVDRQTEPKLRSSAQGLFMMMTNGVGASLGTYIAGEYVINKLVFSVPASEPVVRLSGWQESWLIFAAYGLVVFVAFFFIFKAPKDDISTAVDAEENAADPINADV